MESLRSFQNKEKIKKSPGGRVTIYQTDSEELRKSRIPDQCIIAIWVEFTSNTGNRYQAIHVADHPIKPYILLCGLDKDIQDFKKVEEIVSRETHGIPRNLITDRDTDICDVIRLGIKPTQNRVAELSEKYSESFEDVSITQAHFKKVP